MTPDEIILQSYKILDEVLMEVFNEPCNVGMPGVLKAELDHIIRARFRYRVNQLINPLPVD